ncbi:uracil-DNA glycosylase family protein [Paenirhodobacter populi]|uniref:uracil-DNA glycosylase family protein n=1 Tax=Paenirhodobacter populi TaxID=2306993 RepID=UPI00361FD6A0
MPRAWRPVFAGVDPQIESPLLARVQDGEFSPSYPSLVQEGGRHLFRAFSRISPARTRVVVIGQDPYPEHERATGRAFEDGAAYTRGFADSIRKLFQSAVAIVEPDLQVDQNAAGWNLIRQQVRERLPNQRAIAGYFDTLAAEQGVLFLNAAWTFTDVRGDHDARARERLRGRVQRAHQALWRPVTLRLIERLALRRRPPVFLLFGGEAQSSFRAATRNLPAVPSSICCAHPGARQGAYYAEENPLARTNNVLAQLDRARVVWWPPLE